MKYDLFREIIEGVLFRKMPFHTSSPPAFIFIVVTVISVIIMFVIFRFMDH